ncbi:Nucleotide-binding universal stress protein, UspA family [Hyunsoonleella jejuensis]|uniref:Nucleotide-binding universal stress protein, UspA family n=1 Tax=Hyunsoonleella jejuensis TaxID=419940 RepID=A0A1H9GGU1_9FLAO|nr:universal stress protein [Hyunsoonleella jejuensis]SEQ49078.1 Nucleotide-binding universal stress protein, UspA family [Hyunsoonleella jejuensis]
MKAVLLPTDFSNNSINAINYAVALLKDKPCKFYFLNVQKASSFLSDDMMTVSSSATVYKTLVSAAKTSIENIINKIKAEHGNMEHQYFSIVDYDNFIDAIHQTVDKYDIDLIVMGTKGASGLQKVLFGSNTVRVINRCSTPILTIPGECKYQEPRKIAFTAHHIELYTKEALAALNSILKTYKAKLTILHLAGPNVVAHKRVDNMAFFDTSFPEAEHDYIDVVDNDIVDTISNYMKMQNFNLLAMVKKPHSFLERLLHTYTEEKMAYSFDLPFLVLTNPEL